MGHGRDLTPELTKNLWVSGYPCALSACVASGSLACSCRVPLPGAAVTLVVDYLVAPVHCNFYYVTLYI